MFDVQDVFPKNETAHCSGCLNLERRVRLNQVIHLQVYIDLSGPANVHTCIKAFTA